MNAANANRLRYLPGSRRGHYESYFLRANHSDQKQAFWLRYTLFIPAHPDADHQPTAEIWAAWFDERGALAVQQDIALNHCRFERQSDACLQLQIGPNTLLRHGDRQHSVGTAEGRIEQPGKRIRWQLEYRGGDAVLPLFPESLYERALPKAKVVTGLPNTRFSGTIWINDDAFLIDDWVGSENHNWGSKHTDEYAWGQVCGFDNEPDSFLECATARIKLGPVFSPWFNVAVLRLRGQEYRFNSIRQALCGRGEYGYFHWSLRSHSGPYQLHIQMQAQAADVAGLNYRNPPGGSHTCLNTKVAYCRVELLHKSTSIATLASQQRAAFEILTDDHSHNIPIQNRRQSTNR